jgi:hypothetical protein
VDAGRLIRLLGGAALLALALITAVISYQHGLDVVHTTGTTGRVAYLVPLVADLLIFASSLALLDAAQNNMPRPGLAVASLTFGIVATVAMNVADGWSHGVGGALVSALAPVTLVLSYETLMGVVRRARQRTEQAVSPDGSGQPPAGPGQCPHRVAETAEDAVRTAFLHGRDCFGSPPSLRRLSAITGVHRDKVAKLVNDLAEPAPVNGADPVPARPAPELDGVGGRP